jgi:hypothetical protein
MSRFCGERGGGGGGVWWRVLELKMCFLIFLYNFFSKRISFQEGFSDHVYVDITGHILHVKSPLSMSDLKKKEKKTYISSSDIREKILNYKIL